MTACTRCPKAWLYEQYEAFDELEEVYLEMEEQVTALIASYVDEHLELFAKIIK